jgi:poly(U)-specific endoribonuclease
MKLLPRGVGEIVRDEFNSIGWDVQKNAANGARPPAPQQMEACFSKCLGRVQQWKKKNPPVARQAAKVHHPTNAELKDLNAATTRLWELDTNRLEPEKDYCLDLQGGKKVYQQGDAAPDPLFKKMDESIFKRPTYQKFIALLDNYERACGVEEDVTPHELKENRDFINEIMKVNFPPPPCMCACLPDSAQHTQTHTHSSPPRARP